MRPRGSSARSSAAPASPRTGSPTRSARGLPAPRSRSWRGCSCSAARLIRTRRGAPSSRSSSRTSSATGSSPRATGVCAQSSGSRRSRACSSPRSRGRRRSPPDHVLGIGAATRTLASLTVRRPVDAALDLGTGSGAQALLASRHAQRVVATDINPRALRYARTNVTLNGTRNVDLREGSLFAAVEGDSFDLIVSNPPFVVSPDTSFVYRDAGSRGDTISETVVQGAAAHLRAGGFATVVASWVHTTDEDGRPGRA